MDTYNRFIRQLTIVPQLYCVSWAPIQLQVDSGSHLDAYAERYPYHWQHLSAASNVSAFILGNPWIGINALKLNPLRQSFCK